MCSLCGSVCAQVSGFIVREAEKLHHEEASYMVAVEENIVYASTNKLLNLEKTLGKKLDGRFDSMCTQYDTLDLKEASSDLQLAAFNMLMRVGIIGAGIALLMTPRMPGEPSIAISLLPTECFSMNETLKNATAAAAEDEGGEGRITIATLFSFLTAAESIEPICIAIIQSVRKFQFGGVSVNKVRQFLAMPQDPWPKSAKEKKLQRLSEEKVAQNFEKLRWTSRLGKSMARLSLERDDVTKLSISNTDRKRTFMMCWYLPNPKPA